MEQLGKAGEELKTGIYYGWCLLKNQTYCTVVSVGWNPFFKNEKKTIEAHLIANLDDFYGEAISLLLFGYLRDEANFKSLG
jgi:riboflavin kinase